MRWNLMLLVGWVGGWVGCGGGEGIGVGEREVGEVVVGQRVGGEAGDEGRPRLRVYAWEAYLDEGVLADFGDEFGVEVEWETYLTSEEMMSKLASRRGRYDVVMLDSVDVRWAVEAGYLRRLDTGKLAQHSGVRDRRWLRGVGEEVAWYSVPYLWGTTLVAYRRDVYPEPQRSWDLVFGEGGGHPVAFIDDVADLYGAALMANGWGEGKVLSEEAMRRAHALLAGAVERRPVVFKDVLAGVEALRSGEVAAAVLYSGDAAGLVDEEPMCGYFIPEEGAVVWVDVLALTAECADVEAGHAFLDFLLRPEVSARSASSMYCASPVAGTDALIDAELLADEAIYPPPAVLERCQPLPITGDGGHGFEQMLSNGMRLLKRSSEEREAVEVAAEP